MRRTLMFAYIEVVSLHFTTVHQPDQPITSLDRAKCWRLQAIEEDIPARALASAEALHLCLYQ